MLSFRTRELLQNARASERENSFTVRTSARANSFERGRFSTRDAALRPSPGHEEGPRRIAWGLLTQHSLSCKYRA